jgi:hypothetical protein
MDEVKAKTKVNSRLAFFRRPLRLKGNSSISIPLGVVLLFPCIVVVLILVLFVRHPKSGVGILMPAGAPPAIRYAYSHADALTSRADFFFHAGKSAKSMTRSSSQAV